MLDPDLDVVTVGGFMAAPQEDLTLGGQPVALLEWCRGPRPCTRGRPGSLLADRLTDVPEF